MKYIHKNNMWNTNNWKDYELLDTSNGEKLERFGDYVLIRPDPQAIWNTKKEHNSWKRINGHYHRSSRGGGEWEFFKLPETWKISYELPKEILNISNDTKISFNLKPFSFKHTGIFPEQATNWDWCSRLIANEKKISKKEISVLNLFAYTGGATLACAKAGAKVTHVDASKGMVAWAKENAISSNLADANIRWLVDDCVKFVEREIRRGNKYDAIIMDPPSYGRGPKGEIWKIEENIYNLIDLCSKLLNNDSLFFLINSYTTGLQAGVLKYMLEVLIKNNNMNIAEADEIGLKVSNTSLTLPCGASGRCYKSV